LSPEYPWYTPYQFAGNTPIQAIDLDGLEEFIITKTMSTMTHDGLKGAKDIDVYRNITLVSMTTKSGKLEVFDENTGERSIGRFPYVNMQEAMGGTEFVDGGRTLVVKRETRNANEELIEQFYTDHPLAPGPPLLSRNFPVNSPLIARKTREMVATITEPLFDFQGEGATQTFKYNLPTTELNVPALTLSLTTTDGDFYRNSIQVFVDGVQLGTIQSNGSAKYGVKPGSKELEVRVNGRANDSGDVADFQIKIDYHEVIND
jgi:hypothetical protein